MDTLVSAILVGLVGVFCMLDSRLLGRLNFEQPLIGATLVGLVLGDVPTGLAVGAAVELVSMGLVQVGAAVPPIWFWAASWLRRSPALPALPPRRP